MTRKVKVSQSEIDGVQYRRAKTWQIAFSQLNNGSSMAFFALMGMVSYIANQGYGIAVAAVGFVLTASRIFDGVFDPLAALVIDKLNTRFGKIRIVLAAGWFIRALAAMTLFVWASSDGFGIVFFVILYLIYIAGSSIMDIAGNMLQPVMSNDPSQRPLIGVWATIFNYMFPMAFSLVTTMVILPRYGNEYTVPMLANVCTLYVVASLIILLISFIGITPVDKPENFHGINQGKPEDEVKFRDMLRFLKGNRPFQLYIISSVSDKLAQQTVSQTIVSTMMFGILIGDIQLGTMISMISMLPGIIFAIVGGKYAGKFGSKNTVVTWTWICTVIAVVGVLFCSVIDMRKIPDSALLMVLFFLILLLLNGAKMCVTTGSNTMRADIVDYELDRSGKYMPATVTATYNFVDQIVTSLSAAIVTGSVALIGFTDALPQPTDAPSTPIFIVTMFLYFGMAIIGWIFILISMRFYKLTKSEMVSVHKRIQQKKQDALKAEESN